MKNKKREPLSLHDRLYWIFTGLAVALAIFVVVVAIFAIRMKRQIDSGHFPEVTATALPEQQPIATPSDGDMSVTSKPSSTPTSLPESTPTPEPIVTPTAEPTPEPTAEPTPEPTPIMTGKLLQRVQRGDNVYYEIYDDGILFISGTGSTWDFESALTSNFEKRADNEFDWQAISQINCIIIAEGIERMGNNALGALGMCAKYIVIPKSLRSIGDSAFLGCGTALEEPINWTGLDLSQLEEIGDCAFALCSGLDAIPGITEYTATPTPTPTPTPPPPTPTPDPEHPRLMLSFQMGDDAYYEYWDNGVIYIKGTGSTWDVTYYYLFDQITEDEWTGNPDKPIKTISLLGDVEFTTVIVEEGITRIGEDSFPEFPSYNGGSCDSYYLQLPSTLKAFCTYRQRFTLKRDLVVSAYEKGKPVEFTVPAGDAYAWSIVEKLGIENE